MTSNATKIRTCRFVADAKGKSSPLTEKEQLCALNVNHWIRIGKDKKYHKNCFSCKVLDE